MPLGAVVDPSLAIKQTLIITGVIYSGMPGQDQIFLACQVYLYSGTNLSVGTKEESFSTGRVSFCTDLETLPAFQSPGLSTLCTC